MTSQSKLNAGAEYLLYRIWATLQTAQHIHPESLLTCVGGLAGYACRKYAQQTKTDSITALIDSPLSIWALVSRAVIKLGEPPPDINEIVRKANEEDQPRLPDWHRPAHPAIVYLKQLWPQTLPIAQRFCPRPIHLPVLYGIALQRAIEHTQELLSPTLAASISMESAIAMSRVELPEPAPAPRAETAATLSPALGAPSPASTSASARSASGTPSLVVAFSALPVMRATPASKSEFPHQRESAASSWQDIAKRVPPSARVAAIACLAFVTTAGAMYRSDSGEMNNDETGAPTVLAMTEPTTSATREPTPYGDSDSAAATPATDWGEGSQSSPAPNFPQAAQPAPLQARTGTNSSPEPTALFASTEPPDDDLPRAQPVNYGAENEGVMRDDSGQTIRMAAETEY